MAKKHGTGIKGAQKKNAKALSSTAAKGRRPAGGHVEAKPARGDGQASNRPKRNGAAGPTTRHVAAGQGAPRDPRLPEAGTVLRKADRLGNVRCECTVEADGIRYRGQVYRSLSAAAGAAAEELGIKGAQNGYIFWGLSKPARAGEDPLTRLQKAWGRYEVCARSVVATAPTDRKPEVIAAIERHRSIEIAAA